MKIRTLHPIPDKQGVNIDKIKYDTIKEAIIRSLKNHQKLTFKELTTTKQYLANFNGSKG